MLLDENVVASADANFVATVDVVAAGVDSEDAALAAAAVVVVVVVVVVAGGSDEAGVVIRDGMEVPVTGPVDDTVVPPIAVVTSAVDGIDVVVIVPDGLGVWLRSNWIFGGVGGAPVRVIGTGIDCDMTA